MSRDSFGWYGEDAGSVIVPEQKAVACYSNDRGNVVLRQEADEYEERDDLIIVAPCHARTVAQALIDVAGLDYDIVPRRRDVPQITDQTDRRHLIKAALVDDPTKSNREIARLVGCSDKTVGTVRAEIRAEGCVVSAPERELTNPARP